MEIVKIIPNVPSPQRGTSRSVGLDFFSPRPVFLQPGDTQIVGLGIKIALPPGHWGLLKERSSMACCGVFVLGGVIDEDYRGEVMVILHNISREEWRIDAHQKICQLIVVPVKMVDLTVRTSLTGAATARGEGRFGSTDIDFM